jgi:D-alanyl-D-alanine endopeptidase (penicillin-binding protein 7)
MKKIIILLATWACMTAVANSAQPSVYLYNETTGQVVVNTNSSTIRPIASVTKLMTAIVTLDHDPDVTKLMYLKPGARLPKGYHSREDVLKALLVKSDNVAAESIADDYPGGRLEFMKAMNKKAEQIGLKNTHFDDPSGLIATNVSTVEELGSLIQVSALYPFIRSVSVLEQAIIEKRKGKKKTKIVLGNTNRNLLSQFKEIVVSKTGFTSKAGFSVGLALERAEQKFVIVVLGAKTKEQRAKIVKDIIHTHVDIYERTQYARS